MSSTIRIFGVRLSANVADRIVLLGTVTGMIFDSLLPFFCCIIALVSAKSVEVKTSRASNVAGGVVTSKLDSALKARGGRTGIRSGVVDGKGNLLMSKLPVSRITSARGGLLSRRRYSKTLPSFRGPHLKSLTYQLNSEYVLIWKRSTYG